MKVKYFSLGFFSAVILILITLYFVSKYIKKEQVKLITNELKIENKNVKIELIKFDNSDLNFLKPINTDFNKNNKIYLLNFWATWCTPCVAELPELQLLNQKNSKINFGYCTDDENDKVVKFMKKNDYKDLPIFTFSKDKLPVNFNHNSIPCTYIIDNESKIMYKIEGIVSWNSPIITNFIKSLTK